MGFNCLFYSIILNFRNGDSGHLEKWPKLPLLRILNSACLSQSVHQTLSKLGDNCPFSRTRISNMAAAVILKISPLSRFWDY
jgi:hypothetical protein